MASYSKRLFSGTITMFVFIILSAGIGYLLKFYMARNMELKDIGLFYAVVGFVSFFMFLRDIGLSDSLSYFIPKHIVEKSDAKIKTSILFVGSTQFAISLGFVIFFWLISGYAAAHFFKDQRAALLLIFLAFYFLVDGFNEVLFRVFHGFQDILSNQGIEFAFNVISFLFIIAFIFFRFEVQSLGVAYVLSALLTLAIFLIIFLYRTFPSFISAKGAKDPALKKEMLSYSFHAMIGNLAYQMFSQQSIFFLTFFAGLESVAYYIMALSIAKISIFFFRSIGHVFTPIMAELWEKKDKAKLNLYVSELIIFSFIVQAPLSIALIIYSKDILTILFGTKFVIASALLKIHSLYFLFYNGAVIFKLVSLSIGLPKYSTRITLVNIFVNLVMNIILVPRYGLIGAGIADLSSSVFSLAYALYVNRRHFSIRIPLRELSGILVSSAAFGIVAYGISLSLKITAIFSMLASLAVASSVYVLLIFLFKVITLKKIDMILREVTNNRIKVPLFILDRMSSQE